jgi:hypothetical protein
MPQTDLTPQIKLELLVFNYSTNSINLIFLIYQIFSPFHIESQVLIICNRGLYLMAIFERLSANVISDITGQISITFHFIGGHNLIFVYH